MPQKPGLETPTPSKGHLSHNTSILNATLLRSKQELSSVCSLTDDSVPIMVQGKIFDGVRVPAASNPDTQNLYLNTIYNENHQFGAINVTL